MTPRRGMTVEAVPAETIAGEPSIRTAEAHATRQTLGRVPSSAAAARRLINLVFRDAARPPPSNCGAVRAGLLIALVVRAISVAFFSIATCESMQRKRSLRAARPR